MDLSTTKAAGQSRVVYDMAIEINWAALGLGSVIAFLIGWFLFGLLGAVILALIVMILLGIIKFR
jgi:hypothetical protein